MKENNEKEPCAVHNHGSSGLLIAGVFLAIALGAVGEKAVSAWKEVQLKNIEVLQKSK
jgi:hypothetical protein